MHSVWNLVIQFVRDGRVRKRLAIKKIYRLYAGNIIFELINYISLYLGQFRVKQRSFANYIAPMAH
ncbi:MAG TPA: hypothetical protein DDW50_09480 [Firmicutes bacterium]|nr:hypothetical protein [Bacillota bacterium]